MQEQLNIQKLLNRKLMEYKMVNPSFSIRALAKRLEMQPSATNEILKGKRRVSLKKAEKIATKLMLNPSERAELFRHFTVKSKINKKDEEVLKLSAKQFSLISEWSHFAILSLVDTKGFKSQISWIANRLGINEKKTVVALENLKALHLIKIDNQGKISRTQAKVNTTDDILDISIQQAHLNDLEMAKTKLVTIPVAQRDFSSFTLPVDPELIPKAKEILRKAQDELDQLMSDGQCTEVYRACMYFFPLTQTTEKQ